MLRADDRGICFAQRSGIDHSAGYSSRVEVTRSKPVEADVNVAPRWHGVGAGILLMCYSRRQQSMHES